MDTRGKILTPQEALVQREHLRKEGRRLVALTGTFDVLVAATVGRIAALASGNGAVVAVVGDGPEELLPRPARAELAAGLRAVDWVVPLENDAHAAFLERLAPDHIAAELDAHAGATADLIAHVQRRQSS